MSPYEMQAIVNDLTKQYEERGIPPPMELVAPQLAYRLPAGAFRRKRLTCRRPPASVYDAPSPQHSASWYGFTWLSTARHPATQYGVARRAASWCSAVQQAATAQLPDSTWHATT